MAASSRRDLFLTVGGTTDPLATAMKAGKSVMREFGGAAVDTVDAVQKAFEKLGGNDVEASARTLEAAYTRTFANIRANAEAALNAPSGSSAVQIVNANAARALAENAEAQAAALRMVAAAAAQAAAATDGDSRAAQIYATQVAAAAVGAERYAQDLRAQALVLGNVEGALVASGAATIENADAVTASHTRMGASGMILQHVVRSTTDSFAAGLPPAMIFGEQIGRLSEAAALAGGTMGKFGEFMGGPWGLAVTIAVSALVPLVLKLAEAGDLVDSETEKLKKNATETEAARTAKERFATTTEGVTAALNEQREALKKQEEAQNSAAEQENIAAQNALRHELAIRKVTEALLEQAKAQLAAVSSQTQVNDKGDLPTDVLGSSERGVAALQAQLDDNKARIAQAERQLNETRIGLAEEAAKRQIDPLERIKKKYDDLAHAAMNAARDQARSGQTVTTALTAQLAAIEKNRKAELDVERDREQREKRQRNQADRQVGRQISVSEGTAIVHGIGGTVTSGDRSYDQQKVLYDRYMAYKAGTGPWAPLAAKPGTSAHESGAALDIAKQAGLTLAVIREAFAKKGVHLTEALDEGNHYHVAWGKKGPSQETIDNRAEAAAQKKARDDEQYAQLMLAAQQDSLRFTRQQATDLETMAALDVKEIETRRDRLISAAQAGVTEHKWSQAKADELIAQYKINADTQTASVKMHEHQALLDRQLDIDRRQLDSQVQLLDLQLQLATTLKERKRIALEILAKEEQSARDQAQRDMKSDDPKIRARGEQANAQISAEAPYRREQLDRQYADPMEKFRQQLQDQVGDMNTALKSVEADGLQSLEDGLLGIISGTESVGSAFKKMANSIIADLLRIGIEKAILSIFGSFAGGKVDAHADGVIPGFAIGNIPGFALGGGQLVDSIIKGPGNGTSDSILAFLGAGKPIRVSNGESIMTEAATREYGPLLKAMNDNSLPRFATGVVPSSSIFYPQLPSAKEVAPQQNGVTLHMPIEINAQGADAAALKRVEDSIDQLRAEVPGTAIQAIAEARSRFMFRDGL
ncbi:hypothetical protein BH10PSE14_BH10PSE14_04320 [soil metagenome]